MHWRNGTCIHKKRVLNRSSGYIAFICMISLMLASMSLVFTLQYSVSNVNRILREYIKTRNNFNASYSCLLLLKRKIIEDVEYIAEPEEYIGDTTCRYVYKSGVYGYHVLNSGYVSGYIGVEPVTVEVSGINTLTDMYVRTKTLSPVVLVFEYAVPYDATHFSGQIFKNFSITSIYYI